MPFSVGRFGRILPGFRLIGVLSDDLSHCAQWRSDRSGGRHREQVASTGIAFARYSLYIACIFGSARATGFEGEPRLHERSKHGDDFTDGRCPRRRPVVVHRVRVCCGARTSAESPLKKGGQHVQLARCPLGHSCDRSFRDAARRAPRNDERFGRLKLELVAADGAALDGGRGRLRPRVTPRPSCDVLR